MGVYQIKTDGGTYNVTTDDGASATAQAQQPSTGISSISPFEQQMTKSLYNGVPFGKDLINMLPNGKQIGQDIQNIPQPQGIIQGAGQLVGQGLSTLPAMAGGAAMIPGKILGTALGIGAQQAGQSSSQGASPMNALGQGAIAAGSTYLGGKAFQGIGEMVGGNKIYNDKLVSDTAKSVISKIQGAVQPLRDLYSSVTKPFANQMVDADTFQKALSVVPKSIRQDFIDEYGSQIVDPSGRPQTTVGNLQKMELELKDFINQPKFGQKINAADYNVAESAKQLKQIRLSQLPQDAQNQIKALDSKFGPVIQASNDILPKLADKSGRVNTKFLFNTFKNPADAGMRDYLTNLKSLGIDLTPELSNIRGWVARQGAKRMMDKIGGRITEGAAIGGAFRAFH